jgi:hypothetical protein
MLNIYSPNTAADPGNSERGGRDSFGKNPYTGMCRKAMKYKWTITKKVMILSTSQNFIKNFS